MSKTNFFSKYLKNIGNLINSLLEKNLNKLNLENLTNIIRNNKIVLTFVAVFILFVSYLSIPNFYKQEDLVNELKKQLKNGLGLNFEFTQDLNYSFFPKPHFKSEKVIIQLNEDKISKIAKLKIYISLDNFFSLGNFEIRDVIIENANFNFNKKNYNFFIKLLDNNFYKRLLKIKNSNIFFKNSENEVLFINKILDMKYFFDSKESKNIIYSENEIFNIPYSIKLSNNRIERKLFYELNFNFPKLKIINELNYNEEINSGKSEFIFNKSKSSATYKINNGLFEFSFFDRKEEPDFLYNGMFNLNPFYSSLQGQTKELNLSLLFDTNALIAQLLKTEIFNNKNIDFKLSINAEKINKNFQFENINLKTKIQDGLIDFDLTEFEWKNLAIFKLLDSLIYVKSGELVLDGKLEVNIINHQDIYKFLLTPKNYRKKIEKIDLNFSYNFDKKTTNLSNIRVNDKYNQKINKNISNLILKGNNLQNKIYLKKILNELIKSYDG